MARVAILVDGGFFLPMFRQAHRRWPKADDVVQHCHMLMESALLKEDELFRIYYYDCLPYDGKATNPLTGETIDFSGTTFCLRRREFLRQLALKDRVAFRRGQLSYRGWEIDRRWIRNLIEKTKASGHTVEAQELAKYLKPNLKQKRVDIKIGLDIAWLSTKNIVEKIVLVTADSDFIPAMKFARREGITVCLNRLGHHVKEELIVHADFVIPLAITT